MLYQKNFKNKLTRIVILLLVVRGATVRGTNMDSVFSLVSPRIKYMSDTQQAIRLARAPLEIW